MERDKDYVSSTNYKPLVLIIVINYIITKITNFVIKVEPPFVLRPFY